MYCLFCILQGSSGFVLNAPNITSLSHTPADPQHFLTHYQSKWVMSVSVCVLLVLDWQNWLLIYLNWLSVPCRHGQLLHDMVKYSFKPEGCSDWLLGEWVCCDWLLGNECVLTGCCGDECILVGLNKVFILKIVAGFVTNHQWSSRDQTGWEEAYRDTERAGTVDETRIGTHINTCTFLIHVHLNTC